MILLDTNVLSECMRPAPAPVVIDWLDAQDPQQVWICAISRAEIELGIALLPEGKRKRGLRQAATTLFTLDFPGRCLTFDESAASAYAGLDHNPAHPRHAATSASAGRLTGRGRFRRGGGGRSTCASTCSNSAG